MIIAVGAILRNYKFLVSIYTSDEQAGEWLGRTRMAIADVKEQSVNYINGIPEHAQMGYKQKIFVEDDKNTVHYVMREDNGSLVVYNINTSALQATRGLEFKDIADITTISKLKAE